MGDPRNCIKPDDHRALSSAGETPYSVSLQTDRPQGNLSGRILGGQMSPLREIIIIAKLPLVLEG